MYHIRLLEYGSCDYQEMVKLRDEILRKPLGLHFTEKYLQQEINDILVGCFETNERIGYKVIGDEFLEVSIPHYEMRKNLKR